MVCASTLGIPVRFGASVIYIPARREMMLFEEAEASMLVKSVEPAERNRDGH